MQRASTPDLSKHSNPYPSTEAGLEFAESALSTLSSFSTIASSFEHDLPESRDASEDVAQAARPPREKVRRARLRRRLLIGGGFSGLYLFALSVFCLIGAIDRVTLVATFCAVVLAGLVFYLLYARSKSKRQAEKRLTGPIAVCALAVMLVVTYIAPESRPVFSSFVFVAIAYGMYYLSRRAMLLLSAGTLAGFAAVIGLHHLQRHDAALFQAEMLALMVLALTLPGFVLLAGRVRQLHSALYKAGVKIRNIEEKARRDPMLGCFNRRFMVAALEEQKRLADENGAPLCLAVIDLDHFKRINDDVGHLAGDEVLRCFANVARDNIRQFDVFGRYGGEEFLLILPHTPLLAALNTAERIREKVECHRWKIDLNGPVTVSIGLTQYNAGESVLDLFSRTDTAMYLAKRGGRNQVVVEEPHTELWQNSIH
jgi:diguanylate cyclase (GGDEF)-like protein